MLFIKVFLKFDCTWLVRKIRLIWQIRQVSTTNYGVSIGLVIKFPDNFLQENLANWPEISQMEFQKTLISSHFVCWVTFPAAL